MLGQIILKLSTAQHDPPFNNELNKVYCETSLLTFLQVISFLPDGSLGENRNDATSFRVAIRLSRVFRFSVDDPPGE